jgi:hypothetical protein
MAFITFAVSPDGEISLDESDKSKDATIARLVQVIETRTADMERYRAAYLKAEEKIGLLEQTVLRQNDDVRILAGSIRESDELITALKTRILSLQNGQKLLTTEIRRLREQAVENVCTSLDTLLHSKTEAVVPTPTKIPEIKTVLDPTAKFTIKPTVCPIDTLTYVPTEEYVLDVPSDIVKDALTNHENIAVRYNEQGIEGFKVDTQTPTPTSVAIAKSNFKPFVRNSNRQEYIHTPEFLITTIAYSNKFMNILMDRVQRMEISRRVAWSTMLPILDAFQNSKPLFPKNSTFAEFNSEVVNYRSILAITPQTNYEHLEPHTVVKCATRIFNGDDDIDLDSVSQDKLRTYMAQIVVFYPEFGVLVCRTPTKYVTFISINDVFYERISFGQITIKHRTKIWTTALTPVPTLAL